MPETIQLPTSSEQLLTQLFRQYKFTKEFDVKNPGPAAHFPEFLATFNKEAELDRLANMAEQLMLGVKVLHFA